MEGIKIELLLAVVPGPRSSTKSSYTSNIAKFNQSTKQEVTVNKEPISFIMTI